MEGCPVCSAVGLRRFETLLVAGAVLSDIMICGTCAALINLRAYAALSEVGPEAVQATEFYRVENLTPSKCRDGVQKSLTMLKFILDRIAFDPKEKNFCDFGTGQGFLPIAAVSLFREVYGVDLFLEAASKVERIVGGRRCVCWRASLSDVEEELDLLTAWHALEHIPDPMEFLSSVRAKLRSGGMVVMQVPLFRPSYVVDCHYVLYNEASLRYLFDKADFVVSECLYDYTNSFLTVVARR